MASICQIGLAAFSSGELVGEWVSLIDPCDEFSWINVSIHGIDETHVTGAPTFGDVCKDLSRWCGERVLVCHTSFDRTSIHRAAEKCGEAPPDATWLDSASVARRTWKQFAYRGYGLASICRSLGYSYQAHDALEDAKACGFVMVQAIQMSGMAITDWIQEVRKPIPWTSQGESRQPLRKLRGHPDGPLSGEVIVFTGQVSMPRQDAAILAAKLGADVPTGVTKKTTMLVVGDQDIRRLAGQNKSSKHRKAEDLIKAGAQIRIVTESDFLGLVRLCRDQMPS
jgi:DNA polymerase III subunit epsilon